jgi:dipeptidyl aminopeptidase/acylaminoacyl peptidase
VPSVNNGFAIGELFTRRARAHGNSGDYTYLAMNGKSLPVTVRSLGADSMIMTLGPQEQRYRVDVAGRILGGSITGQGVDIVRATAEQTAKISLGSSTLVARVEKRDYSAPPGAPYTAEEVSFKGPGAITLGGTLTKPKNGRGLLPAAVTITGSGQEDRDEFIPLVGGIRLFRQVADTLSRVGIAVLRLDDRGLGASTGDFAKSTTADFADDIRAALAYLRSRGDIDGNRIALIGHSEGGIIAPMVAVTDPKLRAIVTFGGPGDKMIEMSMAQNRWVVDHNPKLTPHERDSLLIYARAMLQPERQTSPMLKFWMSYDPAPMARQVKVATLILQGETDRQVPVDNAGKLAALIRSNGNTDVTVRTFPFTDHLFLSDTTGDFLDMYKHVKNNQVSPKILGAMADWLVARLVGPPVVK